MNILISHVYSQKNRGDAAILDVLYHELRSLYSKDRISIATMESTDSLSFAKDAVCVPSLFNLAVYRARGVTRIITVLYTTIATFVWTTIFQLFHTKLNFILTKDLQKLLAIYSSADIVVAVGGGYINGKANAQSTLALVLVLFEIYIATALKKKTLLYSQSIGPFANNFQTSIARFVLKRVDHIFAREDISIKLLKRLGIHTGQYSRSVDAGFLFTGEDKHQGRQYLQKLGINPHKTLIGITARKWLKKDAQAQYESALAQFTDEVTQKGQGQVVFIPQVSSVEHNDDDGLVNKRIISLLNDKSSVFLLPDTYDHTQIKSVYSNLDYLVGTRMHSCIFSLTSFVPVIAIEYEYKTRGIMEDLNLGEWVIRIEDVTAKLLIKKFKKLVTHTKKYGQTLHKNLPDYIARAKKPTYEIQRISLQ